MPKVQWIPLRYVAKQFKIFDHSEQVVAIGYIVPNKGREDVLLARVSGQYFYITLSALERVIAEHKKHHKLGTRTRSHAAIWKYVEKEVK